MGSRLIPYPFRDKRGAKEQIVVVFWQVHLGHASCDSNNISTKLHGR